MMIKIYKKRLIQLVILSLEKKKIYFKSYVKDKYILY